MKKQPLFLFGGTLLLIAMGACAQGAGGEVEDDDYNVMTNGSSMGGSSAVGSANGGASNTGTTSATTSSTTASSSNVAAATATTGGTGAGLPSTTAVSATVSSTSSGMPPVLIDGTTCADAADVTNATLPYQLIGTYTDTPSTGGSCASPYNAIWYQFTPSTTGMYQIDLTNTTSTIAYARAVVFEGISCSPYGTEIACAEESDPNISVIVSLTQGQPYLIMFHTDGSSYTMVDPSINIGPPTPGAVCTAPEDVSNATFPHQLTGTFGFDPAIGGSCDTSHTNSVWFSYTASTTSTHTIAVSNTSISTYGRLAVFDTVSCSPLGTELSCVTDTNPNVSTTAALQSGQSYLIQYHSDGNIYSTVDPAITITP